MKINVNRYFSFHRLIAIFNKEFIQLTRDRVTFSIMLLIPIIQLVIFGFAINTNPKHLPTAILNADTSPYTRAFLQGMVNTRYFRFVPGIHTEAKAEKEMSVGRILFIVSFPPNFSRDLVRGLKPQILLEADGSDPVSVGPAISSMRSLSTDVWGQYFSSANLNFSKPFAGNLFSTAILSATTSADSGQAPINLVIHQRYNPEQITSQNIVPGLLGVVLTMTLVFVASLAITRERERGTMENLLSTPVRPLEIMLGKLIPYVVIGYLQVSLILLASAYLFDVHVAGHLMLIYFICLPFIGANLAVGLTFSSIAKNQLQAQQLATFFFLPSLLLSGFMFPYYGMPNWAQYIGIVFPLTHFVVIIRGILLKGNGFIYVWPHIWPILLFACVMMLIGVGKFQQKLD